MKKVYELLVWDGDEDFNPNEIQMQFEVPSSIIGAQKDRITIYYTLSDLEKDIWESGLRPHSVAKLNDDTYAIVKWW